MTVLDEGKLIRNEVAKLRPDKRRRYPDELRARILDWVERAVSAGMIEPECSKLIGVKTWRFVLWRRLMARLEEVGPKPRALVPIVVTDPLVSSLLTVVAPSGYRVEGLSLAQVVELLRGLA